MNQSDPHAELSAMKAITEALNGLQPASIQRILRWIWDIHLREEKSKECIVDEKKSPDVSTAEESQYKNLADFYAAASPNTDTEKALVVGYGIQTLENSDVDLDAQRINSELKHMGHGIKNITAALNGLMSRKPQLVVQTRKSGSSKQARKKYRLTTEGMKYVQNLFNSNKT